MKMRQEHFEYLQMILERDGELIPSKLVEEAQDKDCPIHDCFTWNNAKAGDQYRLIEGRNLCKRYNVYVQHPEEMVMHVPAVIVEGGSREGSYTVIPKISERESEFDLALGEAMATLRAARAAVDALEAVVRKAKGKRGESRVTLLASIARSLDTASAAIERLQ